MKTKQHKTKLREVVLLRRRRPGGRENPLGKPMVVPQRVGKFVEHFLGIRSFLSPIILTSEERICVWIATESKETGLEARGQSLQLG